MQARQLFLFTTLTLVFLSACGLPPPEFNKSIERTQQGLNMPEENAGEDTGSDRYMMDPYFWNDIPEETARVLDAMPAGEAYAVLEMYDTYLRERKSRGLSAPVLDAVLTFAAYSHSSFMQNSGKYIHSNESGAPVNYVDDLQASENVGHGFHSADGAMYGDEGMSPGYYGSRGHADNLNDPDTKSVGFGFRFSEHGDIADDGCVDSWNTQLFK